MMELFSNFFDISYELDWILHKNQFNFNITEKAIKNISLLKVILQISKEKYPSRCANKVFIQKINYYQKCFNIEHNIDISDLQFFMFKDLISNSTVQCLVQEFFYDKLIKDGDIEKGNLEELFNSFMLFSETFPIILFFFNGLNFHEIIIKSGYSKKIELNTGNNLTYI
jgi:hypothetical protein